MNDECILPNSFHRQIREMQISTWARDKCVMFWGKDAVRERGIPLSLEVRRTEANAWCPECGKRTRSFSMGNVCSSQSGREPVKFLPSPRLPLTQK